MKVKELIEKLKEFDDEADVALNNQIMNLSRENGEWQKAYQEEKDKQFDLLREIKELETQHLLQNSNDYISKKKIKDKIEELSKTKGDLATHIAVSERIRALQEILEESEEK